MNKCIIGITGAFGVGKSTAARFFESKGYKKVYLSQYLEKEAVKLRLPQTRKTLQDLGNELREKKGAGILMEMALNDLRNEENVVVDGIRNIAELKILKKAKKGLVLGIIADRNVRFDRLKKMKRREKLTPKLFEKLDLRDLGIGEKITGLQTAFCIALADFFIDSNKSIKEFEGNLDNFLTKYGW